METVPLTPAKTLATSFLKVLERIANSLENIEDMLEDYLPEEDQEPVIGDMPNDTVDTEPEAVSKLPPTIVTGVVNRKELEVEPRVVNKQ